MKRIKWTPVLLLFPISIIIFIIDMRSEAWTPFSLFFIIGFILMMCLLLLIDRFFIIWFCGWFILIYKIIQKLGKFIFQTCVFVIFLFLRRHIRSQKGIKRIIITHGLSPFSEQFSKSPAGHFRQR